ncbi:MAG: hypothetical protein SOY49_01790 [Prevotella sp.]|nr:hypothetical protein [Prevotella sp.]
MMKKTVATCLLAALLAGCEQTEDQKAAPLMSHIEALYAQGRYRQALDSIRKLRVNHPNALEARKKSLRIWQDAYLKMVQQDIARTDSALQAVTILQRQARTIRERNFLGIRKDSLQIRYDALCGTVRVIHRRQGENR